MKLIGAALGTVLMIAGCTSPEANRTRGGDRGGDRGNRGEVVEMHAGSEPYYKTPQLIGSAAGSKQGDGDRAERR